MTEEFNLSNKMKCLSGYKGNDLFFFYPEDVKEFIKRVKEEVTKGCMGTSANCYLIKKEIDKLAGKSLI